MKLTRAADYAIRILTHLAASGSDTISEDLAKRIDVPFNHLAKVVQILGRQGYLITRKGKGGGIRLARDPKKIDLAEVIEVIEGPIIISDCLFHKSSCSLSSGCKVRTCLGSLRSRMLEVLSDYTIHDLAPVN